MLTDTHAHLDDPRLAEDISNLMLEGRAAGISRVYVPNCDEASLPNVLEACRRAEGWARPMVGIHPTYVRDGEGAAQVNWVHEQLTAQSTVRYVAVGEVGLDLYWRKENLEEQKLVFLEQIRLAEAYQLPLVIHSRDALPECLECVNQSASSQRIRGIFHCFSGTVEEAERIVKAGFLIGIGGNVTYPKNPTIETLKAIGLQNVVLETDSPYLAPVPFRGKPNSPLNVPVIAAFLSDRLGLSLKEVGRITTQNALRVYEPETEG